MFSSSNNLIWLELVYAGMSIQVDCPECEDGDIDLEKIDGEMMYVCDECDYSVNADVANRIFGMI